VVGANLASRDLKAKTAAIVFDSSNDYSVGLAKAFRTQFLKNGGTIPIEVPRAAARTLKPSWRASRRRMST
jgi:branched-chain amino acid transport system substrate-binding protein